MAYGTNAPFGLQPRQYLTGATFNGQLSEYLINPAYATLIYSGDPVTMLNDGTIGRWSAGHACSGTFWGCKYTTAIPNAQGNAAFSPIWGAPGVNNIAPNTFVTALIADDPTILYDVQASSSANAAAAATQLGVSQNNLNLNANLSLAVGPFTDAIVPQNPGSGSSISGQSGFYLDTATISASANLLLKIVRLTPRPGNVFYPANTVGVAAGNFNNVICALNNNTFKGGTGTAGGQVVVATGNLTAANMQGMSAAPVEIVAAPGAGLAIIVNSFVLSMSDQNNNTAYANGGVIGLQYGTTAALAGTRVTTTQAATILTTNSLGPFTFTGVPVVPVSGATNAGSIRISNATAPFITGTPDYQYTITYTVVPFPY